MVLEGVELGAWVASVRQCYVMFGLRGKSHRLGKPGINDCAPSVTAMNQTDMFLERIHRLDGESCPPTSQTYHFVPSGMHHNHLLRVPHTHPFPPLIYPTFSLPLLLFPVQALCKYFIKDYFKFANQDVSQWSSQIFICIVCLTQ